MSQHEEQDPVQSPSPEAIRAHRQACRLTQTQAAAMLFVTERVWQMWEAGDRDMHPAFWELFCVKSFLFPKATKKPRE